MPFCRALVIAFVVSSAATAEYAELEAIRQSSRQALRAYAERFAAEDPKYEGVVTFGKALKTIEDAAKVDLREN